LYLVELLQMLELIILLIQHGTSIFFQSLTMNQLNYQASIFGKVAEMNYNHRYQHVNENANHRYQHQKFQILKKLISIQLKSK
jgi:hypothetical protein